jgi:lipopolysaccharide export system permease protein
MRILHRYILKEMLKALGLGLAAVSGVTCFVLVLPALQNFGLGPLSALQYMALSVPKAVYIALPLSSVLAATLVYGRLAADNEIMACRASGVPMSSLFWPAILLALIALGASLGLASWPLPASSYAAKQLTLADVERLFFSRLGSSGKIKVRDANFEMTVDRVVGDMLYGPTLKYRGKNGQTYCYAPYGRVDFDQAANRATLSLWEAAVVDEANTVPVRGTHSVALNLPTSLPREEDDLDMWHLMAIQRHPEQADRMRDLPEGASEAAIERARQTVRARAMADMHGRLATSVGCFGMVLIGVALAVRLHTGHLLTSFGLALVPWVGAFGTTIMAVKAASRELAAPEAGLWIIWLPNLLAVALGVAGLAHLAWFWTSPVRLRDRLRGRGR